MGSRFGQKIHLLYLEFRRFLHTTFPAPLKNLSSQLTDLILTLSAYVPVKALES